MVSPLFYSGLPRIVQIACQTEKCTLSYSFFVFICINAKIVVPLQPKWKNTNPQNLYL